MKSLLLRLSLLTATLVNLYFYSNAQTGIPTYQYGSTCNAFNQSVYNLACGQTCLDIKLQTPNVRATSDYLLSQICYNPRPWTTPGGNQILSLYCDDVYGPTFDLPFSFCFYDSIFTKAVLGSNGILTFDYLTNGSGSCANSYIINATIPDNNTSNTTCSQGSRYYPRSSIMIAYSDLDPRPKDPSTSCPDANASGPGRKIEWRVEGTAPGRVLVVSFYNIGTYGVSSTAAGGLNTFQMVLYESTGIIDFYFLNKGSNSSTNAGRAIMGIQDWTRNNAVFHPSRNNVAWTAANEGWRFTPNAGASRFVSSELLSLSMTHVAWGDTTTTTNGTLDITFPNVCVSAPQTRYIIKTTFASCSGSEPTYSQDTVIINQTNELHATATSTPTNCGAPSGTVTVTVPSVAGTAPFTYTLDNPPGQVSTNHTYTFTNVTAGPHTVYVSDANGCGSTIPITVGFNGTLAITASTTATSCTGVNNGSILVDPPAGTPPYQYSLNSGPNQGSNFFNNLAPGTYTVHVQDAGGCSGTTQVTVVAGPGISATTSSTATSCPGVNNGTITVTPTSGTGPYQYSIDGGAYQNSNVFTNVSSGTHYIVVKDALGCTSNSIAVNVSAGSGPTGSATSTPTSCPGVNNGIITATALTGTGPFQYSLDGGAYQSSNVFNNVAAGSHNVVIKDAQGCISASIPVSVTTGSGPTGMATQTPTSCSGVNNGSIVVTPTSGTAPYQYSLDGSAYQSSNVFNNVSAGPHNVVFQDAVGCVSASIPVTVTAGPGPGGTATSTSTSCPGVNNGTITANGSGGTAPYQYSLDGGAYQLSNLFTNVAAGSHNVVVKDAVGCISSSIAVTVGSGTGVTATVATTATSCSGVNNGTITVTPTNGSSPYQYSLDGGAYQSSNVFTNVSAGSHNVVVQDATTCTSGNLPVTVGAGAGPTGTTATTATSCSGATNGTITVTPSGGSSPYQYALDGGAYQLSNVFNNVPAGTHNVIVKDAAGCISAQIPATVAAGAPLNVTVASTNTSCNGAANGTITLTPTNGSSPYQYSLNGGSPQTINVFNNLAPGSYTINVVDANGCSANNLPATIVAGAPLTATIAQTNVTCNGLSNGSFTVTVQSPGTAPYQYSLDNSTFQASNTFPGLAAGSYTVYFRDNVGCTGSQPVTITQPTALAMNAAAQPVLCNGQSNGVITATGSGGTTPYQYSLNGTTYQAANSFNVAAGTYTVYIKDNNGCVTSQANVVVSEPPVLTLAATTQNATCNGGNDGVITANGGGGNGTLQYSIDGTNYQSSNTFNVIAGNYTVYVKDANNCTMSMNTSVGLNNTLTFAKGNDTTICEGGSAQLSVTTNANQITWTPASTLSNATIANPVASPRTTTPYTVAVTLGGCSTNGTVTVNVNPAPVPNAGNDADICFGQNAQLLASGAVSYQWSPTTFLSSSTIPNPQVIKPDKTTQYSLNVVDANGCPSLVPGKVVVHVTPPITVAVSPKDTIVSEGDVIQLNATSIGTSYTWSNASTLSNANIANPVATMPANSIGNIYTYIVTASTSAGCQGTGTVVLKVYKGPDIYMVTGFTPNHDGRNDKFIPFPVGIKSLNYFKVYNRWGELMFSTTTLNDGWDGTYGGREQATGVYVWIISGVTKNDKTIFKKGTVTLIR